MPLAVYVLALAAFAQGMSEFMLSGLVPDIAADLGVSVATAGALTSAFAAGMVVGAPLMAVAALRWSRRAALLAFLTAFLAAHVAGAVTGSFAVLLVTRVVGALANAGFLAVAVATAAGLAGPAAKGRATSVLLSGVTLACVAGVPGGAWLGQVWGWRAAFWAVVVLSAPALVAVLTSVPGGGAAGGARPGAAARREVRALRRPRLLLLLLLGALVNGGTFCAFTYLAPVLTDVAGFGEGRVPVLLALFGLGSFAGVTAGGRLADRRPLPVLAGGGAALTAGWAAFALTAGSPAATLVLVFLQGALAFAVGSTLIARALYEADDAPTLGGAFATAAFNVGAALGPALGGAAIGAGLGYRAPLWAAAALAAAALAVLATARAARPAAARTA